MTTATKPLNEMTPSELEKRHQSLGRKLRQAPFGSAEAANLVYLRAETRSEIFRQLRLAEFVAEFGEEDDIEDEDWDATGWDECISALKAATLSRPEGEETNICVNENVPGNAW